MPTFAPEKEITAISKRIKEADVTDDSDLYRLLDDLWALARATAALWDIAADEIFTTLWKYDKSKRASGRRPHNVVKPIRHFASGLRFANRFIMKVVRTYQKLYVEDIANERAAKKKKPFSPGRR